MLEQDGDGVSHRNEYFFEDGGLFFALEIRETTPIWEEQDPDHFGREEHRYYLVGDRLLRWLHTEPGGPAEPAPLDPNTDPDRAALLLRRVDLLQRFVSAGGGDLFDFDTEGVAF